MEDAVATAEPAPPPHQDAASSTAPSPASAAENVAVCIRVRPLTEREECQRDVGVLQAIPRLSLISITDERGQPLPGKTNVFQYDHIFDAESSTPAIYDRVAQRIVHSTLEGINGTIFAYGQTSSGKTFTMQGPSVEETAGGDEDSEGQLPPSVAETEPGILQLAVEDIFSYIEQCSDRDFLLRVSFVEIYNEVVRDLLNPADKGLNLKLREDPRKGVYVDCQEEIITDYDSILQLLHAGNQRRTVGQTAMNERSSRSHSIFRIVVESKKKSSPASASSSSRRASDEDVNGAVLVASLSLVDLAGSESLRHTAAEGIRQREAGNINKSLLTLSRVINSLAKSGDSAHQNAPYRDSKLTRLLQNSLGGNTRTLIIACVTPSDRYIEETRSTLQFAARAKNIQFSATVNEILDDQAQLRRLKREVHELKKLVNNDAINALKAENEALMSERDRNKAEIGRLTGLMLSSTTLANRPSTGGSRQQNRGKRMRETWCPGDFPISIKARRRGSFDASPVVFSPRKRHAGAKENQDPQQLLDAGQTATTGRVNSVVDKSTKATDGMVKEANRRWIEVLTCALQGQPEADPTDEDQPPFKLFGIDDENQQKQVSSLVSELRYLVTLNADHDRAATGNKQLRTTLEELKTKKSSTHDQVETLDGHADDFETCNQELLREREKNQSLLAEKEHLAAAATAERDELTKQISELQSKMADQERRWEHEKQEMRRALEGVSDELEEFRSRVEGGADGKEASAIQELAKVRRQWKRSQMELARTKEEQEKREELHQETVEELEATSQGTIEELSKQLEEAFVEIEEIKLSKAEVVDQLKTAFDRMSKELMNQLEEARNSEQRTKAELDDVLSSRDNERKDVSEHIAQLENELRTVTLSRDEAVRAASERDQQSTDVNDRLEKSVQADTGSSTQDDQDETAALKIENAQLLAQKQELIDVKTALEEQLLRTSERQGNLAAKVKALTDENSDLEENLEAFQTKINELSVVNASLQERRDAIPRGGLTEISGELNEMLTEIAQLRADFDESEKENEELSVQSSQLAEELDTARSEVIAMKSALAEKEHTAKVLQAQLDAKVQTISQLQTKFGDGQLQRDASETASLLKRAKQLEEGSAMLNEDLSQKSEQIALLRASHGDEDRSDAMEVTGDGSDRSGKPEATVQAEERSDNAMHATQTNEGDRLRAELAVLQAENARLHDLLAEIEHHVEGVPAQRSTPRGSLPSTSQIVDTGTSHAADSETHSSARDRESIDELNTSLEKVSKERDDFVEDLQALEAQLMYESAEKMKLVVATEEQAAKLRDAETRVELAMDQLAQVTLEKETLSEQMSEWEETKRQLQQEVDQVRTELAALQSDQSGAKLQPSKLDASAIDAASTTGDNKDSTTEQLQQQLDIQQELRRTLELDVKSYEETLTMLRREVKDNSNTIAELLEKLKALESELDAANVRNELASKEYSKLEKILAHSKEEQEEMQRQMKQRLVAAETREMQLEEQLGRIQAGSSLDTIIQEVKEDARMTQAGLENEINGLKQQVDEAQTALAQVNDEWKQQQATAEQALTQLKAEQTKLEEQVTSLETRASESAAEAVEARRALDEALEQKASLEREMAAAESRWEQMSKDREKQSAIEMNGVREQLHEAQEELEEYQKYADEEIHRLRASIEQTDTEMEAMSQAATDREVQLRKQVAEKKQLKLKQQELEAKCEELYASRRSLNERYEQLATANGDEAVDDMRVQLRAMARQVEAAEKQRAADSEALKAASKFESEVYESRRQLEELAAAVKSAKSEAAKYSNQLVEAQLAKDGLEKRVETQKARIDKLEKVKMTTETLEVFRKLKSDRQQLQAAVAALKEQLRDVDSRVEEQLEEREARADQEIALFKEHMDELRAALRAEKQSKEDFKKEMRAVLHDEREKSQQEIASMQALLKAEKARMLDQSGNDSYLEKENLDLLVENRRLKRRLDKLELAAPVRAGSSRPGLDQDDMGGVGDD